MAVELEGRPVRPAEGVEHPQGRPVRPAEAVSHLPMASIRPANEVEHHPKTACQTSRGGRAPPKGRLSGQSRGSITTPRRPVRPAGGVEHPPRAGCQARRGGRSPPHGGLNGKARGVIDPLEVLRDWTLEALPHGCGAGSDRAASAPGRPRRRAAALAPGATGKGRLFEADEGLWTSPQHRVARLDGLNIKGPLSWVTPCPQVDPSSRASKRRRWICSAGREGGGPTPGASGLCVPGHRLLHTPPTPALTRHPYRSLLRRPRHPPGSRSRRGHRPPIPPKAPSAHAARPPALNTLADSPHPDHLANFEATKGAFPPFGFPPALAPLSRCSGSFRGPSLAPSPRRSRSQPTAFAHIHPSYHPGATQTVKP